MVMTRSSLWKYNRSKTISWQGTKRPYYYGPHGS